MYVLMNIHSHSLDDGLLDFFLTQLSNGLILETRYWSIVMENIQSTPARPHGNSTARIKPRRAGVPCVRCRQMKVKTRVLSGPLS